MLSPMARITLYHVLILKNILKDRQEKNIKYSLRAFAKELEISPASLSQILSQKKGLSEKFSTKIAQKLNLSLEEKELFIISSSAAHSRSSLVKSRDSIKLAALSKRIHHQKNTSTAGALTAKENEFLFETNEVQELISKSAVHSVYRYKSPDEFIYRSLHILKDKATGAITNNFFEITYDESRKLAAMIYFIKKENGRFRSYYNNTLDGTDKVTGYSPENLNLTVNFDKKGLPTVPFVSFSIFNTTKYIVGKMIYTEDSFSVSGTLIDYKDASSFSNSQFKRTFIRYSE